MTKSLLVGYGVVGKNLYKELECLNFDIYDKYKKIDERKNSKYDIAFICVDTPSNKDNLCDTTEIANALNENEAELYVIKSTILPGTTLKLKKETGKRIVFSPEYYGGTQHANNFVYDFTILGGVLKDTVEVQQILQKCYDARHIFRHVKAEEAEITKYMENAWLAYKVSFMHEFSDICERHGVAYEIVRELFTLDPRVNPSHTFVYQDSKYWTSHCLDKDVPAIAISENSELLKNLIKYNKKRKNAGK